MSRDLVILCGVVRRGVVRRPCSTLPCYAMLCWAMRRCSPDPVLVVCVLPRSDKAAMTAYAVVQYLLSEAAGGADVLGDAEDMEAWMQLLKAAVDPFLVVTELEEMLRERRVEQERMQVCTTCLHLPRKQHHVLQETLPGC